MSSADDLRQLCASIKQFQTMVATLATTNPEAYDALLNIPNWRQTGTESFVHETTANAAKFLTHADLLLNANNVVDNENVNKVLLNKIAPRLQAAAETCTQQILPQIDNAHAQRLSQDLSSISTLLHTFIRPQGPNTSRKP